MTAEDLSVKELQRDETPLRQRALGALADLLKWADFGISEAPRGRTVPCLKDCEQAIIAALSEPTIPRWNFNMDESPIGEPFLMHWDEAGRSVFMAKRSAESGILYYFSYAAGEWIVGHRKGKSWMPLPAAPEPSP